MSIQVLDVTKRFGDFQALAGVSLDVARGELVALLGPSGSGKTTLLRIIAGLERPDTGRVIFDGHDGTDRPVQERRVGFVFQHYALFRHMKVFENIAFGLRVRPRGDRPSDAAVKERVAKLLDLVQLDGVGGRFPHQLSGGQRQRIALARALAIEPQVLLLDEPFGALDARVRKDLRRWLRRLHDEVNVASLFVTHDQDEALELADRVVVFRDGRIEQTGTPEAVYAEPATPFVYRFIGSANRLHPIARDAATPNAPAPVLVRPTDLDIVTDATKAVARATIRHAVRLGPIVRVDLSDETTGEPIELEIASERFDWLGIQPSQTVHLAIRTGKGFPDQC